eukprot:jgi/Psemu1/323127/estExt_fgenesh1_pg.C_580001
MYCIVDPGLVLGGVSEHDPIAIRAQSHGGSPRQISVEVVPADRVPVIEFLVHAHCPSKDGRTLGSDHRQCGPVTRQSDAGGTVGNENLPASVGPVVTVSVTPGMILKDPDGNGSGIVECPLGDRQYGSVRGKGEGQREDGAGCGIDRPALLLLLLQLLFRPVLLVVVVVVDRIKMAMAPEEECLGATNRVPSALSDREDPSRSPERAGPGAVSVATLAKSTETSTPRNASSTRHDTITANWYLRLVVVDLVLDLDRCLVAAAAAEASVVAVGFMFLFFFFLGIVYRCRCKFSVAPIFPMDEERLTSSLVMLYSDSNSDSDYNVFLGSHRSRRSLLLLGFDLLPPLGFGFRFWFRLVGASKNWTRFANEELSGVLFIDVDIDDVDIDDVDIDVDVCYEYRCLL